MAPVLWVGAVIAAYGQVQKAQQAKAMAQYNQKMQERNAQISRDQTALAMTQQNQRARRVQGSIQASYGASGVQLNGTLLDVMSDSAANAEMDALTLKYHGQLRAQGYQSAADIYGWQGSQALREGYGAAASTLVNAYTGWKYPSVSTTSAGTTQAMGVG